MILVSVGTNPFSFDRLLIAVDELIKKRKIKEKVIMQIGYSSYRPKKAEWFRLTNYSDMENLNKKAAKTILLTLKQGIGNAVGNFNLKKESLKIKVLEIGEGPMYKRMDKSHRSFRWGTIHKRTAHVRMILEGEKEKTKKPSKEKVEKPKTPDQKPGRKIGRSLSLKKPKIRTKSRQKEPNGTKS